MRAPTKDEQLDAWKTLAFKLNFYRTITLDQESVVGCLKRIDSWVHAHSTLNGERSDKEIQKNVDEAFWKHIRQAEPSPLEKPKRAKTKVEKS